MVDYTRLLDMVELNNKIEVAIKKLQNSDFHAAIGNLLAELGYQSDRTDNWYFTPEEFLGLPTYARNQSTESAFREYVKSLQLVFQLTSDEIPTISGQHSSFSPSHQLSLVFFAVEMNDCRINHGTFNDLTREINKRLRMPAVVFFRIKNQLTITVINRRPHKYSDYRDVLENTAYLLKNVSIQNPSRTHIEDITALSLAECTKWIEDNGQLVTFVSLIEAWLAKLPVEEFSQQFYRRLFDWFDWAVSESLFAQGEENNLRLYFEEMAGSTPLSREREAELSKRVKEGDLDAREKLIRANLRFVIYKAKKYQNLGLELSDLINAGNIGLIRAVDRYDDTLGNKLITYAVWWIRQSILKSLKEFAKHSEDFPVYMPPIENSIPPDANVLRESAQAQLVSSLASLKERESFVITLYYGLDGNRAYTLEEIGKKLKLSRERVRQINAAGLKRLRRSSKCHEALITLITHPISTSSQEL